MRYSYFYSDDYADLKQSCDFLMNGRAYVSLQRDVKLYSYDDSLMNNGLSLRFKDIFCATTCSCLWFPHTDNQRRGHCLVSIVMYVIFGMGAVRFVSAIIS